MDILTFENQEEAERNLAFYLNYNNLVRDEERRLHNEAAGKISSFLETKEYQENQKRRIKLVQEQRHYFISELGFCGDYYYREIPQGAVCNDSLDTLVKKVILIKAGLEKMKLMEINPLFYTINDHTEENRKRNEKHPLTQMIRIADTQPKYADIKVVESRGLNPDEIKELKRLYHFREIECVRLF